MTQSNAEAFPATYDHDLGGLTKREYAAIHILAGLVNDDVAPLHRADVVKLAVELADRLMAEL